MRESRPGPRHGRSRARRRIGVAHAVPAADAESRAAAAIDRAAARWRAALLAAVVTLVLAMSAGARLRVQLVAAAVLLLCVSVLMRVRLAAARRVGGERRGPSLYTPSEEG